MRKLTIQRKKAFASCLSKFYLFISCNNSESTMQIDNLFCKVIGQIANGETSDFEIPDDSITLFISYSLKRPNNDIHTSVNIPYGTEDVSVSIKTHMDPFFGNPLTATKL